MTVINKVNDDSGSYLVASEGFVLTFSAVKYLRIIIDFNLELLLLDVRCLFRHSQ